MWHVLINLLFSLTLIYSQPVIENPPLTVAFREDFNLFDPSLWNILEGRTGNATSIASNVQVYNGSLHLLHTKVNGKYYVGRVISTFKLQHGYFEARAKFAKGSGWHDSFWLVSWFTLYPPPSRNIEIDVAEVNTYNPFWMTSTYSAWTDGVHPQKQSDHTIFWQEGRVTPDLTQFHTFGVLWTSVEIVMFLDGEPWLTRSYSNLVNPLNVLFTTYLWDIPGKIVQDSYLPSEMEVDYFQYTPM